MNWYRVRNLRNLLRGTFNLFVAKALGIPHFYGVLHHRVTRGATGEVLDYGVVSHLLITTAGVNKIVDALRNVDVTTIKDWKFHGFGSGTTGPVIGNTALETEYTTQYATDSTRPTGTQVVGGSNNVYRSVATFAPDATVTVTETGLFDQAAIGGGDLLDRFTFTGHLLSASVDSLVQTIDVTFPAGN